MSPKPAYETLNRLINKEWHTSLKTHTNENGRVCFEGFYGDYDISVSGNTKAVTLGKKNSVFSITI